MSSFDAYNHNLSTRLSELRQGDIAYELHARAILETLPYVSSSAQETNHQRIVDVGCGLGFLAVRLASWPDSHVVGIDPSNEAIELARKEHESTPNLDFYAASAQKFPGRMEDLGEPLFDRAIVNMVLHGVDDEEGKKILSGVREMLVRHGILTLIVPGRDWLVQKLIEKAQADGMAREEGIAWVANMLRQEAVELEVGIHGRAAYEHPITIYNRSLTDYAELLISSGFGVTVDEVNAKTDEVVKRLPRAFVEWGDHTNGYDLSKRDRHILMTQVR